LTASEIEKLLAAAKSTRNPERDYAILHLMFRHGLRVSELCSIKLSDISLELRELHVPRLKGSDSSTHPFHNGETSAVAAWLAERAKLSPPANCDTLFISERRKPLSRVTVWVMVREVARVAGLEHLAIHPHMLRHSCGYSLVNRGIDIRSIQGYWDIARLRARLATPRLIPEGSRNSSNGATGQRNVSTGTDAGKDAA